MQTDAERGGRMRGLTDATSGWQWRGLRCWGADPGSRPLPPSRFGDFDPTPTRVVPPTRACPYGPARVPDWAPR